MPRTLIDSLGHRFADLALREQALTHRSAAPDHNERLEFLGDGLVNLVIAEVLYQRFPKADEGWLTRARSQLVCESSLAAIARQLGLGSHLHLGAGEVKAGGMDRDSILADALEAMIGAIHLDADFKICRAVVLGWFESALLDLARVGIAKDAKTHLQEWLQARGLPLPEYVLVATRGDDHDKVFDVSCRLEEPSLQARAEGLSRRQAEQHAARSVLEQLPPQ